METKNWLVTAYDKKDGVIEAWVIENRTEHEAQNEAMADLPDDTHDWTMVDVDDVVQIFLQENKMTHEEAAEIEGFSGGEAAESECLINVGYLWLEKENAWIKKNNMLDDNRDIAVRDYIIEKNKN